MNKGRDCDGDEEESSTCLPMVITSSRMVDVRGCQTDVIKVLAIGGGGGGSVVSSKWNMQKKVVKMSKFWDDYFCALILNILGWRWR